MAWAVAEQRFALGSMHGSPEYAALRLDLLRKSDDYRARLKALEEPASARAP
jgi:hypothetical protein